MRAHLLLVLGTALIGAGCSSTVPAQPHPERPATCSVRNGDTREQVIDRCGLACGSGMILEGRCSGGDFWSSCANDCDVYGTVAVCYLEGKVVKVKRLAGAGMAKIPTCGW